MIWPPLFTFLFSSPGLGNWCLDLTVLEMAEYDPTNVDTRLLLRNHAYAEAGRG